MDVRVEELNIKFILFKHFSYHGSRRRQSCFRAAIKMLQSPFATHNEDELVDSIGIPTPEHGPSQKMNERSHCLRIRMIHTDKRSEMHLPNARNLIIQMHFMLPRPQTSRVQAHRSGFYLSQLARPSDLELIIFTDFDN